MKRLETGRVRPPHLCGRISILAAGLLAAAFLGHSATAQAVPLTTLAEVQEGMVQDIAGQSDASADPYAARIWLAQGRVRAGIRAADRQRMFSEDRVFDDVNPGSNEQILAIEVDEDRQQIWTLTESALYRETYATPNGPGSPLQECYLELACMHTCPPPPDPCLMEHHLQSWEDPVDLKVWHGGPGSIDWVFLLTTKRIIAIRSDTSLNPAALEYHSSAIELFREQEGGWFTSTVPGDPINALEVHELNRLRIQEDLDGRLMAYVLSKMQGFGTEAEDRSRALVMLCDLNKGGQFDSPTFDVVPGPGCSYAYFNPIPDPPEQDPTDEKLDNHTALGLDVFAIAAGSRYMYVACGKKMQVQQVNVTNAFTAGVGASQQIGVDPDEEEHIRNVLVDPLVPTEPGDRFFAVTREAFYVCDVNDPPFSWTENEFYGEACERDLIHVLLPDDPPTDPPWVPSVWTAVENRTDHVCKVMDVSTNDHPVQLIDEYFGISSCDGAVAIPPCDVYLPTFGGVVRYSGTVDPPYVFQAVPDSYMPAEYPLGSGNVEHTEHIEIGYMPLEPEPYRLYTASNKGDFMEFEIDHITGNPLEPLPFVPNEVDLRNMGWSDFYLPHPGGYYGNDVVFLDLGSEYFVLTNLTNASVTAQYQRQHAVLAYRWDDPLGVWTHESTAMTPIIDGSEADSKFVDRLVLSASREFAFCAFPQGFFVVDLRGLTATPPQDILAPQVVFVQTMDGKKRGVGGIAQSKGKLFAYVNAPTGHKSYRHVRIYEWNEATGYVDERPKQAYLHGDLGFPSVFPIALPKVFNGRFLVTDPASGAGYVHFAAGPEMIQLQWPGGTANTLSFTGYWRSDYPKDLQDCRSYEFGQNPGDDTRILVVKNHEAFALVKPW